MGRGGCDELPFVEQWLGYGKARKWAGIWEDAKRRTEVRRTGAGKRKGTEWGLGY